MIEDLKDKTLEEIRSEYKLTDFVIFEDFIKKFKNQCLYQIERDIRSKREVLNSITVSQDVAHILKYYDGSLDYSDAEEMSINYVGNLTISYGNPKKDFTIEIYTEITEDEELILKNQADPILIKSVVHAPKVNLKAEYNSDALVKYVKEK